MKTITIKDDAIKLLLEEKGLIVMSGRELDKQIKDTQEKLNKTGLKNNKIQDKIVSKFKKHQDKIKLEEFEEVTEIILGKDGNIEINVVDRVEEFKDYLRKEKTKALAEDKLAEEDSVK